MYINDFKSASSSIDPHQLYMLLCITIYYYSTSINTGHHIFGCNKQNLNERKEVQI